MNSEHHRETERENILDCLNYERFELSEFSMLELAKIIERSIYNSTIDKAKEKDIPNYWGQESFVAQYSSIGHDVKINLDPKSNVNRNQTGESKNYTINCICNFINIKLTLILLIKKNSINVETAKELFNKIKKYIPNIDPKNLATLSPYELNPKINEPYIEHLRIRGEQSIKPTTSSLYKCICGCKQTICYEIQTRSLDEGGTLFVKCMSCMNVWRPRH